MIENWLARIARFFRRIPDPQEEFVDVICSCIRNDYTTWKSDGFRFVHAALQFSIWTASGWDSVGLEVNGRAAHPQYKETKNSIVLTRPQKKRLWQAIHNPNSSQKKKQEIAEEIISRVLAHYDKKKPSTYMATAATASSCHSFIRVAG